MSNTPQTLQIFSIISKLEDLVNESPRPKIGGQSKRIVDLDTVLDLLGDMKVTIPEDIRRANSLLIDAETTLAHAEENAQEMLENAQKQSEAMLNEANARAAEILAEAHRQFEELVSENSVLVEAQRRADLLALKAEHNAHLVYDGAKQYADEILADLQLFMAEYQRLVEINRNELGVRTRPPQPADTAAGYQPPYQPDNTQRQAEMRAAQFNATQAAEAEYPEDEPKPAKKGWWKRLNSKHHNKPDLFGDDFDAEDDYDADAVIPAPRKSRRKAEKYIDMDE